MYEGKWTEHFVPKSARPREEAVDPQEMTSGCELFKNLLVEKAAKLQAILDTTVDGIITINEQAIIQSFNKAAERIFGYSADEVIGQNVNILQPSPYREHHNEYVARYLRTGERKIIGIGREVMGRRKDGSTFPLYLAVSEVWAGGRRYFTGILRDMSEYRRASAEISSLARFPEENPHPILRVARDGKLLYANATSRCLLETWGCEPGQYLPAPWRGIVLESLQCTMNREIEVQCGERTYELTLTPVSDAEDVNIYGKDITERKRAEEALRVSEEKHRALVQSSSDAIVMVDRERRIISVNQAFLDLFEFEREEIEGKSTRVIFPTEESFVAFGEKAYPVIEITGSFRNEWEFIRKDGTVLPAEESLAAIRGIDGSIRGYVAVIRDITERREAETKLHQYRNHLEEMVLERTQQLEEAHKALLQEEKLKLLGTISAELAHEIRNPLMSIGGFARRIQKKHPEVFEIGIVLKESERLEEILKRIENYLRPVELRPRGCSVNEIINEALALISPDLNREGVNLNLHLTPQLPAAYVDPGVLIQVFINVIRNAASVMNKDGMITVETFESDQNVHVHIRAPVPGMKIKDIEHPYMPFGDSKQDISMPVCFRLLRGMGGHLSLKQEKDSLVFAASLLKIIIPEAESEGFDI